jgi:hypothetical protein
MVMEMIGWGVAQDVHSVQAIQFTHVRLELIAGESVEEQPLAAPSYLQFTSFRLADQPEGQRWFLGVQ